MKHSDYKNNKKNQNTTKKNRKNHNGGSKRKEIIKKFFKITLLLAVFLVLIGLGGFIATVVGYINAAPEFDPANLELQETSYLYDKDGNEITQLHGEQNRVVLSINEIPEHLQEAFIAMEDERFYNHFGVDVTGIARASWINLRSGGIVQGASTITQQLARNSFLSTEQTMKRKIQEAWMAVTLEREYSKEEILEKYLNHIYFGNGAYGVEAAAQTYFDKEAGELTLAEAAELAGIPSAPRVNNPWNDQERSHRLRNYVLDQMERLEYISGEEAANARNKELAYATPQREDYPYPYFVDYVLHRELLQILTSMDQFGSRGDAYNAIYTQGLHVHTTLDTDMQSSVEDTLNNNEFYPETTYFDIDKLREAMRENNNRLPPDFPGAYIDEENGIPQPQSAVVLADPGSGEVMALGGGRDYHKQRNELLRYTSWRQPGSAIKPITVYAPAFEEKEIAPGSVVDDAPKVYDSIPEFTPSNWDGTFWGLTTVRQALVHSRNIPAVSTLEKISPSTGARYAAEMGINTILDEERDNLSLALGGFQGGATALDMAQAYSTLANSGIKSPLHTVTRIEDRQGNVIWEHENTTEQVISPQSAFMVNDILKDVPSEFVGAWLNVNRPLAAKTGTTDGQADRYLATYTPNLTSIAWMGYDIRDMGGIGSPRHTAQISNQVLNEVLDEIPVEDFTRPSGLVERQVCSKSGMRPTELCEEAGNVTTDLFQPELVPSETCEMHVEKEVCPGGEDDGDYYLPSEYCPSVDLDTRVFLDRPDFILTDHRWGIAPPNVGPNDAGNMPPEEECAFHGDVGPGDDLFNIQGEWLEEEENMIISWEIDEDKITAENFILYRRKEGESFRGVTDVSGDTREYTDYYIFERGKSYTYRLEAVTEDRGTMTRMLQIDVPEERETEEEEEQERNGENNGNDDESENNDDSEDNGDDDDENNNGPGSNNNNENDGEE